MQVCVYLRARDYAWAFWRMSLSIKHFELPSGTKSCIYIKNRTVKMQKLHEQVFCEVKLFLVLCAFPTDIKHD